MYKNEEKNPMRIQSKITPAKLLSFFLLLFYTTRPLSSPLIFTKFLKMMISIVRIFFAYFVWQKTVSLVKKNIQSIHAIVKVFLPEEEDNVNLRPFP